MRNWIGMALLAGCMGCGLSAQTAPLAEVALPGVAYQQPGLTPPELLPALSQRTGQAKCTVARGLVVVKAVVGEDGRLRDAALNVAASEGLGKLALQILNEERFAPGTLDGKPAAVAVHIGLGLEACVEVPAQNSSGAGLQFLLRKEPLVAVFVLVEPGKKYMSAPDTSESSDKKGAMQMPVLLHSVDLAYTDKARKAKLQGACVLQAIVDTEGVPQYAQIVRSLGAGPGLDLELDQNALAAFRKFRFKPAMYKGKPANFLLTAEMNFRLY